MWLTILSILGSVISIIVNIYKTTKSSGSFLIHSGRRSIKNAYRRFRNRKSP
jgi:hypothetical protein